MSLYNKIKQYYKKKHITFRWVLKAIEVAIPKRYCWSCKRAEHGSDGFIHCHWQYEKICPYQKEKWEELSK